MKPARNSLRSRVGRYIAYGLIAAALVAGVSFLHWRHESRTAQSQSAALAGVASQMRHDASAWTHREKDASEMLTDIRDRNVATIGVSPDAILVSTLKGEKYYVADHNGAFSNALLLGAMKPGASSPYQLLWLGAARLRTGV